MEVYDSLDYMQIMRLWLEECTHNHRACILPALDQRTFLPTRLLDVQAAGIGDDIRLVLGESNDFHKSDVQPDYVTLSHCWGLPEKHPLKTTKHSILQRMNRIALDDLSNTFQDAVRVTRQLGKRYLWIDSLCIIQDDEEDWAWESGLMSEVYSNAYCTLSALSSKDGDGGCRALSDIQGELGPFLDLDVTDDEHGHCRIRVFRDEPLSFQQSYGSDSDHRIQGYPDAPLRSRGWALQERELSKKIIHFGKSLLLWECRELKSTSQLPWQTLDAENGINRLADTKYPRKMLTQDIHSSIMGRWCRLVEDYRFLTHHTDKFPALAGLARQYQALIPKAKYLAGIWSTHLPGALLWLSLDKNARRYPNYLAPTWSWASLEGVISYESQQAKNSGDVVQDLPIGFDLEGIKVEKTNRSPKYDDAYGTIDHASLVLSGTHLTAVDSVIEPNDNSTTINGFDFLRKGGLEVGIFYPDVPKNDDHTGSLMCFNVREEVHWSRTPKPRGLYEGENIKFSDLFMCLILIEDTQVKNRYRRIGLARWVKRNIFEGSKPGRIELV